MAVTSDVLNVGGVIKYLTATTFKQTCGRK